MPLKGGLFASVLVLHVIKRWPHNFFYYFSYLRKMTCRFCYYCSCCQSAIYCFCFIIPAMKKAHLPFWSAASILSGGTSAVSVGSIHVVKRPLQPLLSVIPMSWRGITVVSVIILHVMKRHHRRFCYHSSCHERHSHHFCYFIYILVIKGLRHHPLYQHRALSILAFSFILSLH